MSKENVNEKENYDEVTIYLTEEEEARLQKEADERGMKLEDYISFKLESYSEIERILEGIRKEKSEMDESAKGYEIARDIYNKLEAVCEYSLGNITEEEMSNIVDKKLY